MSVLIVGAKGNMGRRYAAILTYLGKEWTGVDIEQPSSSTRAAAQRSDGVIIATPTKTHASLIRLMADLKKPILCEKPVTTDIAEMRTMALELKLNKTNLTMVHQYKELIDMPSIGWSYYNYWNHGRDGLVWDCIQIIALARSEVAIQDDSPVWKCRINGKALNLRHMDRAYIKMIDRWMREPGQDIQEIKAIHEKVDALDRTMKNASDQ